MFTSTEINKIDILKKIFNAFLKQFIYQKLIKHWLGVMDSFVIQKLICITNLFKGQKGSFLLHLKIVPLHFSRWGIFSALYARPLKQCPLFTFANKPIE